MLLSSAIDTFIPPPALLTQFSLIYKSRRGGESGQKSDLFIFLCVLTSHEDERIAGTWKVEKARLVVRMDALGK